MLLLLAEAEVEAGLLPNALDHRQPDSRTRAARQGPGPGHQHRANHGRCRSTIRPITWAIYRVNPYIAADFATQAAARDRVRIERRLELAMEGQRFFDLRRWGIAATVINDHLNGGPTAGGGAEETRLPHLAASAIFEAKPPLLSHSAHPDRAEPGGRAAQADAESGLVIGRRQKDRRQKAERKAEGRGSTLCLPPSAFISAFCLPSSAFCQSRRPAVSRRYWQRAARARPAS